ncbi:MAG: hypothetical protein IPL53_25045 [Ignavibacteria bacterium]|nr:hypothetical protein [Ignavibacteria bacterium]
MDRTTGISIGLLLAGIEVSTLSVPTNLNSPFCVPVISQSGNDILAAVYQLINFIMQVKRNLLGTISIL